MGLSWRSETDRVAAEVDALLYGEVFVEERVKPIGWYIDASREMAAWNAAQEALVAERVEAYQRRWERVWRQTAPMIYEYERWRRAPWWARMVAWAIAGGYLIREVL